MFVDVRGFTALSERITPDDAVTRLNRFYNLAASSVFDLDGTLDKMVGDQVMAFFGAPFCPEDHATRAVRAALNIVSGVGAMNVREDSVEVGAGVATGEVFMGNVGGRGSARFHGDRGCGQYRGAAIGSGGSRRGSGSGKIHIERYRRVSPPLGSAP